MEQVEAIGRWAAYVAGAAVFAAGGAMAARILSPRRPGGLKDQPYECGENAAGDAWGQINVRFYVMGLIFLIFDVELLMLYPWATVLARREYLNLSPDWAWVALVEGAVFIGVLAAGLAYVWARGDIDWALPQPRRPQTPTCVPKRLYEDINRRYAPPNR
ncbi:MAG: NADH-quinone oxidoreductase subunit A [Bacteroidia bacterium]|nr:NADH-quinone oxidoreductase subunit A [Bacteroidia bacterium]MDW8333819.1 NADH-quinone oxidoreductase subunit A [Bacteroidia bacterium]